MYIFVLAYDRVRMWIVEFALPVMACMGGVGGQVGDTPEALNMERRVNMRQIPEVRTKKSFNNFELI
jgi:hypothetical protein